jgi:hypothetical protein
VPAPYFKKYGKHPAIKAFVDGVTAAAIGAIAGAVLVLGKRTLVDIPSVLIALSTAGILFKFKKLQEPLIIAVAALIGILLKNSLMNRKDFIKTSAILGGTTLLPINSAFSQNLQETGMDRLVDKDGNFALQPLPYTETFLEPSMDQETLHLHYTFHHGDAVKAANKDLQMVKKSIRRE